MSSICCANNLCAKRSSVAAKENLVSDAALAPVAGARAPVTGVRNVVQLLAVVLAAASLAACAQSSVVSKNSGFVSGSRQASLPHHQTAAVTTHRSVVFAKKPAPFVPSGAQTASHGLASFYTEGTRTANGERFDTHQLTAAHPTLPFGTKLRVTNVASGRSVTVRVNDRGPYVAGRVVDVSYSAANALGMVGQGVAKVKLDVVQ
jgi:rare lipoprotein A